MKATPNVKPATKSAAKSNAKRITHRKPPAKHQRLKVALVPVLLLVLAYVVFAPANEADFETVPIDNRTSHVPAPTSSHGAPSVAGAAKQAKTPSKKSAWPDVDLQFLASSNPFKSLASKPADALQRSSVGSSIEPIGDDPNSGLPGELTDNLVGRVDDGAGERSADHLADMADELERRPVKFVFRSSKQNVVMLGDEVLREGAQLSPAVRLQDIGDNRLLLKLQP